LLFFIILWTLFFVIQIHSFETDPENTIIRSGIQWFDTAGNPLDAHGGGFFVDHKDEKYYWFGESKKLREDGDFLSQHAGINKSPSRLFEVLSTVTKRT